MTLPLYQTSEGRKPELRRDGHAGLWFDKFCHTWTDGWSMSSGGSVPNPKLTWIETVTGRGAVGVETQIAECALRMVRLVESRGGRWAVYATESRFATGLGRSHPVENGFAWHPTLGAPYIPGSSIRGMVGAWAKAEAGSSGEKERLLGKPDDAGKVCFLDAVPVEAIQMEADVMTPHYANWTPADPPGDWLSPTLIPFLTTAAGAKFLIGFVPRPPHSEKDRVSKEDMKLVESWLKEALEWAGAGAKTAVGYGRFAVDAGKTDELRRNIADRERDRKDRERREAEERRRKEELSSLSPVEREIQELLDNRQDKGMPETTAIFGEISRGHWDGAEKIEAAQCLKGEMEARNQWRETTRARRPERDANYRRTQQVMAWLKGG